MVMGSSRNMVLAELDFDQNVEDFSDKVNLSPLKKKVSKKNKKNNGFVIQPPPPTININNGDDSELVTPYHNGHYLNPAIIVAHNGYSQRPSRARLRPSLSTELEDLEDGELSRTGYASDNTFLSPLPPPQGIDGERGVHSSLSNVNNAITVAPSRTNLNDSNVFVGGRPPNLKRPSHHRNRINKHKGRSRTPDFSTSNNRLRPNDDWGEGGGQQDSQSILNKIDLAIKNKFGDWDSADEGEVEIARKYLNGHKPNLENKSNRTPYFIPKSVASDSDLILGGDVKDDLNLPRLFKPYETVVATSRQVLNDKSYHICLSKDNADPNSILSQAKKTLNFVSGGQM